MKKWLAETPPRDGHARAVICPHAGFKYCGHVMAHAFKQIDPLQVKRVFLLGPSHHLFSRKCLLTTATVYETPLGHAPIDIEVYSELKATKQFEMMNLATDEAEHSLELLLPYIVHVMNGRQFSLVPIVVGATAFDMEATYGHLLGKYFNDPNNLFVISTDFCHWGYRFDYTFVRTDLEEPIHKSIEWLDKRAMDIIETGSPSAFQQYLDEYKNTICGRHPIGILLQALCACQLEHFIEFIKYDQSHHCVHPRESSVSYAAAVIKFHK